MTGVLALLALLCLCPPSAAQAAGDETLRAMRAGLAETAEAIEEFKTMNGGYPESLEELEPPVYEVKPDLAGRPPVYKLRDDGISYELSYLGPDGREGTDDDIRYDARRNHRPMPWLEKRGR
ncbi:MAG TPA: hypothetical protein VLJ37_11570 [bacterium]|nr:hypothetical protein [bacterium]